jgi:hypothetical protein
MLQEYYSKDSHTALHLAWHEICLHTGAVSFLLPQVVMSPLHWCKTHARHHRERKRCHLPPGRKSGGLHLWRSTVVRSSLLTPSKPYPIGGAPGDVCARADRRSTHQAENTHARLQVRSLTPHHASPGMPWPACGWQRHLVEERRCEHGQERQERSGLFVTLAREKCCWAVGPTSHSPAGTGLLLRRSRQVPQSPARKL